MSTESPLLDVHDLSAWYGGAHILFDIALQVHAGEVVALMGRNGAGKSTTLKTLMGMVDRRRGRVSFMGRDISRLPPHAIAAVGLGYVPEDRRIFTDLTVAENLEVGRQPPRPGAPAWGTEKLLALFPALGAMLKRRGGSMSGGEQQMLCIARTLAGNPIAILLDEPSEGLAPVIIDQVVAAILEMKWAGVAVLLAEQNARFTERVADRGYRLEKGKISPA
jgi:branched-chain amino acid transport system ATP-binding protein